MTSWKTYTLKELSKGKGEYGIGASAVPFDKEKYTYLRITDINDDGTLNKSGLMSVDAEDADRYLLAKNDIVFARTGNSTGRSYFYDGRDGELVYAGFLIRFKLDEQKVNPKILKYYTHSKPYYDWVQSFDTGGTRGNINAKTYGDMPICLPPRHIQDRIAGILGAIDDKIENNRRINTNLELQAQALFDEWLCKVNTIKGTFNDIIDATLAGDWGQETLQGNYTHEVYCIRGADIPALRNGDKGKMPIRYILERNYLVKQLRANDIVVEISGGSPTQSTGRVCMITKSLLDRLGKDVVCTNFCRAITPKNGYAIFIFLYWQMLYNKNTMFSYENGTTGIKNLNIADLISKEPIDIPKQEDVDKLNVVLQPIYDQIYANGLQNETLATLRDTLLPRLMNGEIKV